MEFDSIIDVDKVYSFGGAMVNGDFVLELNKAWNKEFKENLPQVIKYLDSTDTEETE